MATAPNGDQEMINGMDRTNAQSSSPAALFSNGEANESFLNFSSAIPPPPPPTTHHLTLDQVRTFLQREPTDNNAVRDTNQGEERMREILRESRRSQYNTLLAAAQDTVAKGLKEKEAQVRRLGRQLSQMRTEMLTWQAKARSLQAQLEEAKKKGMEEGRGETSLPEGDAASAAAHEDYEERKRVKIRRARLAQAVCRECEERAATVVVLPCRHLCLCAGCNEEVAPVPCHVCQRIRTGCFEVFLD